MNARLCASAVFALAVAATSLGQSLGAGATNRVVTSKIHLERKWERNVVTVDGLGEIHGDKGRVASVAETEAVNSVAERSAEVSASAKASMEDSLEYLTSQTNNMAQSGIGIAIAFPPETSDPNIRGFVVKTDYENGKDIQWVHYNVALSLPPNRLVVYETYGKTETVKAVWSPKWDAAGTNITVEGRVWQGVHRCEVQRPTFALGKACLDCPNETWGGTEGIEWGDMVITDGNGRNYFTGYVTNGITHEVAYFDNGFFKEIKAENAQ